MCAVLCAVLCVYMCVLQVQSHIMRGLLDYIERERQGGGACKS
jgi:hypothetical protein